MLINELSKYFLSVSPMPSKAKRNSNSKSSDQDKNCSTTSSETETTNISYRTAWSVHKTPASSYNTPSMNQSETGTPGANESREVKLSSESGGTASADSQYCSLNESELTACAQSDTPRSSGHQSDLNDLRVMPESSDPTCGTSNPNVSTPEQSGKVQFVLGDSESPTELAAATTSEGGDLNTHMPVRRNTSNTLQNSPLKQSWSNLSSRVSCF